jgi:hypothetical protein
MADESLEGIFSDESIHLSETIVDQYDNRFSFYKDLVLETKAYKPVEERILKKGKPEDNDKLQEKIEPFLKNYKGKLPKTAYKEYLEMATLIKEHKDTIIKYVKSSFGENNSNVCLIRYMHSGGELEAKLNFYAKKSEK